MPLAPDTLRLSRHAQVGMDGWQQDRASAGPGRILLIATEGVTDPEAYRGIVPIGTRRGARE